MQKWTCYHCLNDLEHWFGEDFNAELWTWIYKLSTYLWVLDFKDEWNIKNNYLTNISWRQLWSVLSDNFGKVLIYCRSVI